MWLAAWSIVLSAVLAETLLPVWSRIPCPWASSLCSSRKGPVIIGAEALTVLLAWWCQAAGCVCSYLCLPEENTARALGSSPFHLDGREIGGGWEERKARGGWDGSSLHLRSSSGEGLPCFPQPIRLYSTNQERSLALLHPSACALHRVCRLCTSRSTLPSPASLGLLYRWAVYFLSTIISLVYRQPIFHIWAEKPCTTCVHQVFALQREKSLTSPVCVLL